ncbi:extracellular solute-binding protein [Chelativorans salis]|uniref:Extracellular solute-binding protein n=1 Tax=Chelativorans salis TaxID=2978478 RepID=A0ABT2LKR2_9HYPH|nr:extracellular solute-binding protein [Chelativorans sp. EGI FJ00035]MCT7374397.1 extracellular solute-binding protein [Chelativorans sp. EGI FJ00035]
MQALHGSTGGVGKAAGLLAGVAAALLIASVSAGAQEWRTTSSLIDSDVEREPFERYDYVNPDAPKGGTLNSVTTGTFDSFNPFIVRGTSAAGLTNFGGFLWETLMQQSPDEPSTSHPLIAEAFKYPDDYSSATYRLDPDARWHDGTPITAEDVVWSLDVLKEISPLHNRYFANVEEAVALSEREVEFRFNETGNRELPHIMGDLPVLPKHWWEGTSPDGRQRDVTQPTLEPPLGSGPYRIARFNPGSEIVWERVEDYWGADLPVNIGRNNFDRRRFTYIQDENAAWLAFTKGGLADIRAENSSRRWMTAYNFPAVEEGDVIKREFPDGGAQPMQAYVFNMRLPRFQDRRVRRALTLAFDFQTMNRTQFFGQNKRTSSYFEGTELAATGLPEGRELEILEEFRDDLPPEVFNEEFTLPVYDDPQAEREYLRETVRLFREAGWVIRDGRMVNEETGEQFRIEFLGRGQTDEVIMGGFIPSLRKIGIDASLRIVDTSQYISRINEFEFDAVTGTFAQTLSPGNEQRDFWSSAAADAPGSRNLAGIENPVVDALVNKVIFAKDREDLVAATRALDRVLLWNYYMVPQWHRPVTWIAMWNKFGIPEEQPEYTGVDIDSWWIDPEREAALAAKYRSQN